MSKSRTDLENWIKSIDLKTSDRVLDIGGSQNPITDRIHTNFEEYKILDLETPHETKQKPDFIGDIQEGQNLQAYIGWKESFNICFCLEVAEYWYNPFQALKNISYFLEKGGILYISFHTLYSLHKPEGLDYMRLTRYGIEKLLTETGFVIEEIIAKPITEEGREALTRFYQAEGMKVLNNEYTFDEGYLCKCIKL